MNTLTVQQVAKALNKDAQTIRYLIDSKIVDYGISYRNRGSKRKSYIIYADKFFEQTGIRVNE